MPMTVQATNEPFLKHLNTHKTPHVLVTAEDPDFDDTVLKNLKSEGFNVQYVSMGNDSPTKYSERLHAVANRMTGVNEYYAIVAYGDSASAILETHSKATPRLIALIAYYPSAIPDPTRTSYPMGTTVLIHLAGGEIGVRRSQELLGIQGRRKTVRKRMARGLGFGGEMKLGCPSYKYEGVEPGFAERDLEDFDPIAEDLAWGRTLRVLRDAFGMKVDIERIRDQHIEDLRRNTPKARDATSPQAEILYTPTMVDSTTSNDLQQFYTNYLQPSPTDLNARLISRTVGVNRVVDEISLSFQHDCEIPWLLPRVPPTKKQVDIILVSIVCIKAGVLAHEHVYWDQASVLVQIGLLQPEQIPESLHEEDIKSLPIFGAESARRIRGERSSV